MTSGRHATEPPDPIAEPGSVAMPLTDAYRPIRRVSAPQAPVDGILAAAGERRVVLADAETAASRVFLGPQQAPQHLLAPLDLVRRADGHDLELPWCRDPLARLLDARARESRPLVGGELVTLAVSLLRGTREAWQDVPPESEPPPGRWWIDDDGRPLFAPAGDGGPVADEASALLGQAASHTRDRVLLRLIEEARDALERPRRLRRTSDPLEDALFEAFAPRPIARADPRAPDGGSRRGEPDPEPEAPRRVSGAALTGLLERFTDAGFADAVGDAVDRTRVAARRTLGGGRRVPLLVGGVAAALVIGVGLLWPSDPEPAGAHDPGRAGAPARVVSAPPSPRPAATPPGTPPSTPTTAPSEDAQAAAERLRSAIAECDVHGDPLCAEVRDEAAEPLPREALDVLGGHGEAALLDDYGDVAVFRVDDPSGEREAVLLQLVRLDGRWLVRGAQSLAGRG
ncbi:hypothetical protein [Microbacterium rhizophilus]|uniref:hypothetical protein n=1 Tax=Microbacterium rhizophilus TaxID=3138934 RepID=UPI0031EB0614